MSSTRGPQVEKEMTIETLDRHIEITPGVAGGKPRIAGHRITVQASQLVPGDIVFLEAGNYVPADVRLIDAVNLRVDEAALTGESVPAKKDARTVLQANIPLGDRKNTAFMGTVVTYGRGQGIVVSTGMTTQIGLIDNSVP